MMWFKKMPNVAITLDAADFYGGKRTVLTRAFRRDGKLWVDWHGEPTLLKDDGSCVGNTWPPATWEAI